MSTPSIKVGQGNWGIKAGNLLAYANTEKKFAPIEFTSSRALDTATRVNASGNIEIVNANIPRIDYFGGQASLLVEPSAQNVIVQSQNWLASGWRDDATANVTTVSATTGTLDPLGTNTANAISPTSGNTTHLKIGSDGSISFTSGTIYTSSAFFKQGAGNAGRYVQLTYPVSRFTQEGYANFDLQLGTVAVVSGTSADTNRAASIENYGNGWYRCRFTATCNSSGTTNGISISLIETSGAIRIPTFTGTTTDVLYGWGAQTETGSVATSYIPTTTGSITRNADVISVSGAVSGSIGQASGTMYVEVDIRNAFAGTFISLDIGSGADFLIIGRTSGLAVIVQLRRSNGSVVTIITSSAVALGVHKIALGYTNGDYALYIDGVSAGTSTNSTDYPSAALTRCGLAVTSYNIFNDRIRAAALYTTRLTNAQLAFITQP